MRPATIQNLIYKIRDQNVMLDTDLAQLYDVETRHLNQAVKRNRSRFPKDFMFQLNRKEFENLKSQFVTSSWGGRRGLPYAFTEHGVTMLASVLKSRKAVQMNIAIVRAFIGLKKMASQYEELANQINALKKTANAHNIQLSEIYDALEKLLEQKAEERRWEERERIGFKTAPAT